MSNLSRAILNRLAQHPGVFRPLKANSLADRHLWNVNGAARIGPLSGGAFFFTTGARPVVGEPFRGDVLSRHYGPALYCGGDNSICAHSWLPEPRLHYHHSMDRSERFLKPVQGLAELRSKGGLSASLMTFSVRVRRTRGVHAAASKCDHPMSVQLWHYPNKHKPTPTSAFDSDMYFLTQRCLVGEIS